MTPDEFTNKEFYIEVGDGQELQELYVQDWGNPKARTPIFFLHGGPGSRLQDKHKTQFDPTKQRVIFHDQRGSGRSLLYGSLEHNTTEHLVADIEKIAKHLKIEKFILTGSSWGSCLSLAYALEHPRRVVALVLGGIFTGSQKEIDWLDQGQFQTFFPEVWEHFVAATPKAHHKNPSNYHFEHALGKDEQQAKRSAYAYQNLEASVIQLDDRLTPSAFDQFDPAGITIEMYYLKNRCFMPERHILNNARKLTMPVVLVQGRYDMVCPPRTAYELHQALPNSRLIWAIGGHKAEHEAWNLIRLSLLQLTETF